MEAQNQSRRWWVVTGFLIVAALAIVGIGAVVVLAMTWLKQAGVFLPEIGLTFLLVAGITALLVVLSAMTAVFAVLKMADPAHALALPEGSIRAVIAVSLILIFAIMALFLYGQLAELEDKEPSIRFAEQVITTVSTLVVAVASFYFGAKSVTTASEATIKQIEMLRRGATPASQQTSTDQQPPTGQ